MQEIDHNIDQDIDQNVTMSDTAIAVGYAIVTAKGIPAGDLRAANKVMARLVGK